MKAVARKIRPVDDIDPYTKTLVYGPNNAGKTRFAATAPDVLIIDTNEMGTSSARGSGARVVVIEMWEEFADAYWLLKRGKHKYKSVAVDGLTGLQNLCMEFVLVEKERRDPTVERSQPTMRDYGRTARLMTGMLLAYRNLPMHIIFTGKDRIIREEETGIIQEITVDLPAGARGPVMDAVGVIGYLKPRVLRVGGKRRWVDQMYTDRHKTYRTKDRTNKLGLVTQPTMSKVIEAWDVDQEESE